MIRPPHPPLRPIIHEIANVSYRYRRFVSLNHNSYIHFTIAAAFETRPRGKSNGWQDQSEISMRLDCNYSKYNIHPFTCSLKLISNGINEWNVSFSYFGMPLIRFRWHIDGVMHFVKALAVESDFMEIQSSCSRIASTTNGSSSATLIRSLSWARGCWELSVFHFRLIYLATLKKEKEKLLMHRSVGSSTFRKLTEIQIHVWIFYCLKLFGELECFQLCKRIMGH